MSEARQFDSEWTELGHIDYLLDQLARAVERGEIPYESYQALAPRYLARREVIVGLLSPPALTPRTARDVPSPRPASAPPVGAPVAAESRTYLHSFEQPPRHVPWTTILLFLGAFLVVVASAIFAVAVWDVLGVEGKLAFMGALTAGFYVAGWWTRARLELRAGAVALTTVASSMLLFDGWIAIDGYNLQGPLPWAVLLLVCSGVYWFTEIRLAERFFGIIGAAAQVGWWWLLGQGLGWPAPQRLAALAVVAVMWQLASERGRDARGVSSLAHVLAWGAPLLALGSVMGSLIDLVLVRSAGTAEVIAAFVISLSAFVITWRSTLLGTTSRWVASALMQAPLLAVGWVAAETTGDSWWIAGVFGLAAIVYHSVALFEDAQPLSIVGFVAEFSLVLEACRVLDLAPRTTLVVLVALAALWALASRVAERIAIRDDAPRGAGHIGVLAEVFAVLLLMGCSVSVPLVAERLALVGVAMTASQAWLAVYVLLGWFAAAVVKPKTALHLGAIAFSFYAVASLAAWLLPSQAPSLYALLLAGVSALWLLVVRPTRQYLGAGFAFVQAWSMRVALAFVTLAGVALERVPLAIEGRLTAVLLPASAAVVLLADTALLREPASAALAAGASVLTGAEIGRVGWESISASAIGAAGAALVTCGLVWLLSRNAHTHGRFASLAANAVATSLVLAHASDSLQFAYALLILGVAWAVSGSFLGQIAAAPSLLAVLAGIASVLSATHSAGWVTVVVFGAVGFVLTAPTYTSLGRPSARFELMAQISSVAGVMSHLLIAYLGVASAGSFVSEWWNVGDQGLVIALLLLGVNLLAQAPIRRIEFLWYAGFGSILLAIFAELRVLDVTQTELYTTPLALYLLAMGYVYRALDDSRTYPLLLDVGSIVVGLGLPLLASLGGSPAGVALGHAIWVVVLSLVAMAAGVFMKSRSYFFGGVGALAVAAFYRSFVALVTFWWLILGIIGIVMLVVALTWERQKMVVSQTRERLKSSFVNWR